MDASTRAAVEAIGSGRVLLARLLAYWLGLNVLWGSVTTIVLPRIVEQLVPPAIKTTALAVVVGLQALMSIVVQPIAGAASDRMVTPWGRRRPLIVVGVVATLAARLPVDEVAHPLT